MFSQFLAQSQLGGGSFTGESRPVRRMARRNNTPNMDLGAMLSQPPTPSLNLAINNRAGGSGVPNPLIIDRRGAEPVQPPIRIRPALPEPPERRIKSYEKILSEKNRKFENTLYVD